MGILRKHSRALARFSVRRIRCSSPRDSKAEQGRRRKGNTAGTTLDAVCQSMYALICIMPHVRYGIPQVTYNLGSSILYLAHGIGIGAGIPCPYISLDAALKLGKERSLSAQDVAIDKINTNSSQPRISTAIFKYGVSHSMVHPPAIRHV